MTEEQWFKLAKLRYPPRKFCPQCGHREALRCCTLCLRVFRPQTYRNAVMIGLRPPAGAPPPDLMGR